MKTEELQRIAQAAAKNIKTEQDLAEFQQMLTKVTVKAALNAELDAHPGYERHEKSDGANYRNGFSSKTVQTDVGQFELNTPRERKGDFEPKMVKQGQRRFTAMDDKILFLYAQGMTTRESVATFKEMYGADVSASLVSSVTPACSRQGCRNRPGCRLAIPATGCALSHRLAGLYGAENPPGQAGHQQIRLSRSGRQSGRSQGASGLVAGRDRRLEVLAQRVDRVAKPRRQGYPDRLRRWFEGLPRCHCQRVPADSDSALHRPQGSQLAEIRTLERLPACLQQAGR